MAAVIGRWTRLCLRFRWPIVAFWACVLLAGGYGWSRLGALQSNTFTVPGTDSERARSILQRHYGDRSDGSYTVVFTVRNVALPGLLPRLQAVVDRAARVVPTGRGTALRVAGAHVVYGDVVSTLDLAKARGHADDLLRALEPPPGTRVYVTGAAAIQHGLDPIFTQDLKKGESIALPIALAVLVSVFGLSAAVTIPFLFAGATIMGTLGLVYLAAHRLTMPTYVTNLIFLIGLGIAIDYSLLVVYRFREELSRPSPPPPPAGRSPVPAPRENEIRKRHEEEALVRTMQTAGRAVIFSGATVAIGLALLLFMPLPFMRAMGVGGFLIPVVSIAAAATLQPALLSLYGERGTRRFTVLRGRIGRASEDGLWSRLAASIMRRPLPYLVGGAALLLAAAVPAAALHLTPGSIEGIPRSPQAIRGFDILSAAVGPGAISPSQVVVDTGRAGGVDTPATRAALERLVERLRGDSEVAGVFFGPGGRFVDPSRRYAQVIVPGRHEYGEPPSQRFVHRLRGQIIPAARFPPSVRALAGGGPPQGVDFLARAYGAFPWLVLGVLALTYVVLLRAFRSLLLPLKAVLLNLLSVGASYGMLVIVFRWGLGKDALGLYQYGQVEGWIPIFLFAMLFGLSMDYEVFLVTRMREAWDEEADNARAVARGLERTGRIVTAAAIVMVAAFSGFVAGRIVGLQQFGLGLAVAIFVDATIVRAILVPSLMAVMGRYNWWLPAQVARVMRIAPSPLAPTSNPSG